MEPLSTALLAASLYEAGKTLVEKGLVDPALEKGLEPFKAWLTKGYDSKKADKELRDAFTEAIKNSGVSVDSDDDIINWLKNVGLDRLQAPKNEYLRKLVDNAVIDFTDSKTHPPENLMIALGWPRSRSSELSNLLYRLGTSLAKSDFIGWNDSFMYPEDMGDFPVQGVSLELAKEYGWDKIPGRILDLYQQVLDNGD